MVSCAPCSWEVDLGLRDRVTQSVRLDPTLHPEHESGVKLHPGCHPDTLE